MFLNTASVLPYQMSDLLILCTAAVQLSWSSVSFVPNFPGFLLYCTT